MTTQAVSIDKARAAVVIMDYQNVIVKNYAGDPPAVLAAASTVLAAARKAAIPVIYIVARSGAFAAGGPDAEIHPAVAPKPGERVIPKTKTGSFSTTNLDVALRESGCDTLVLLGVSTSGCVLSTVRHGFDLGYKIFVVADACSDKDPEVHRVLTEKVYPRQTTVVTAAAFAQLLR